MYTSSYLLNNLLNVSNFLVLFCYINFVCVILAGSARGGSNKDFDTHLNPPSLIKG